MFILLQRVVGLGFRLALDCGLRCWRLCLCLVIVACCLGFRCFGLVCMVFVVSGVDFGFVSIMVWCLVLWALG